MTTATLYTTRNSGEAAYLRTLGHEPVNSRLVDDVVHWDFEVEDTLNRAVKEYNDGKARVEPRRYSRAHQRCREDVTRLKFARG